MRRRSVLVGLRCALGLGLVVWVVWSHWSISSSSGEEVGIKAGLRQRPHIMPLILAVLLCGLGNLLTLLRWYVLVRAQDVSLSLWRVLRLGFLGLFFNAFLPGSVGGDAVKAFSLARQETKRTRAVSTVLADRLVGLCGLLWLTALVGGTLWGAGAWERLVPVEAMHAFVTPTVAAATIAAVLSLVCWYALVALPERHTAAHAAMTVARSPVRLVLAEGWQAVRLYRLRSGSVAVALGLSVVSHAAFLLTLYLAGRVLFRADEIPKLGAHCLLYPLGVLVRTGFPTPGGLGGTEFVFGELYEQFGFSFGAGVLVSLLNRALSWLLGMVGYFIYLATASEGRPSGADAALPGQLASPSHPEVSG